MINIDNIRRKLAHFICPETRIFIEHKYGLFSCEFDAENEKIFIKIKDNRPIFSVRKKYD